MNYKELFNRVLLLLSSPAKAWKDIALEDEQKKVMSEFVYPMIGLCGLSVFIGTFIGNTAGVSAFQIAMTRCCATFVSLFGGFFLASYLINLFAKNISFGFLSLRQASAKLPLSFLQTVIKVSIGEDVSYSFNIWAITSLSV